LDDSSNRIEVGGSFIAIPLRRAAAAPPSPRSPYVGRNFLKHFALLQRFLLLCYRLEQAGMSCGKFAEPAKA
jgi:hypothetical protein